MTAKPDYRLFDVSCRLSSCDPWEVASVVSSLAAAWEHQNIVRREYPQFAVRIAPHVLSRAIGEP